MLNEKFTFCFKINTKWNLTTAHTTRLKSAENFLKWMSYNKMNQSYGRDKLNTLIEINSHKFRRFNKNPQNLVSP